MQTTLLMTSLEEKQKEQLNKIGKEGNREGSTKKGLCVRVNAIQRVAYRGCKNQASVKFNSFQQQVMENVIQKFEGAEE